MRDRCKPAFEAREAAKHSAHRVRGLVEMSDEALTQEVANAVAPPGSRVLRDAAEGRWRIRWRTGNLSRAWRLHGYLESLRMCLKAAWLAYSHFSGMPCEIPGIFWLAAPPAQTPPPRRHRGMAAGAALAGAAAVAGVVTAEAAPRRRPQTPPEPKPQRPQPLPEPLTQRRPPRTQQTTLCILPATVSSPRGAAAQKTKGARARPAAVLDVFRERRVATA